MATPLPPPSPRPKIWIRVSASPPQFHHPWALLLFLAILSSVVSLSSPAKISYADHCNSTVPEAIPGGLFMDSYNSFRLSNGYFSGGDKILRQDPDPSSPAASSRFAIPRSFYFSPSSLRRTRTPGVLHVEGTLTFLGEGVRGIFDGNLTMGRSRRRNRKARAYRSSEQRKVVNFDLSGFWSESAGKLCMVGPGSVSSEGGISLALSAVFKLDYPKTSTLSTSLANGTVETLDSGAGDGDGAGSIHFDPISVLVYAQKNYLFTQLPQARESCSHLKIDRESIGFDSSSACSYLQDYLRGPFTFDYRSDCRDCGPFANKLGFSRRFMSFNQMQCSEDGRLHMYLDIRNVSDFKYNSLFVPENSLVGEGFWDSKGNRLCLVACRVLRTENSAANAPTGDCTVGVSLWFPSVLTIKNRSTAVGRIWSNKDKSDSGYFSTVLFRSMQNNFDISPGLKYKYTEMDTVRKSCAKSSVPSSGKRRYPDGNSVRDMSFDMNVRNGRSGWGSATLLSIGETIYTNSYTLKAASMPAPPTAEEMNYTIINVSYKIRFFHFNASLDVDEPPEISAEGIYDSSTGVLCMVGCRYLSSALLNKQGKSGNSTDCGILIDVQLAPLHPEVGEHHNGTIRSTRANLDPLYFEPLHISSYFMYSTQVIESIWRMDVEITMVLTSLTLTCIFIGLQLIHAKRHEDVLPSASITMLAILTLGHMIPLVLNFEALFFTNRNRQSVLLWSGGWLEVNEVVVRAMTMVAFLLQFRLLQTAWSSRSAAEGKKGFWVAERRALKLCLPLYITGGLIAWLTGYRALWGELISCAGLILDVFLLPQIILNVFWNSKDKALAPSFYIGTTVVRAMPYLYDAYRASHNYTYISSSYIYASPDRDFYSPAWDIIVPCGGMLLAVIVYVQQRFGGGCIIPPRFRKTGGYCTVSEIAL